MHVLSLRLTALTTLQAEQEAFGCGRDRFMSKPVSIKKLRVVVGEYFRDRGRGGGGMRLASSRLQVCGFDCVEADRYLRS